MDIEGLLPLDSAHCRLLPRCPLQSVAPLPAHYCQPSGALASAHPNSRPNGWWVSWPTHPSIRPPPLHQTFTRPPPDHHISARRPPRRSRATHHQAYLVSPCDSLARRQSLIPIVDRTWDRRGLTTGSTAEDAKAVRRPSGLASPHVAAPETTCPSRLALFQYLHSYQLTATKPRLLPSAADAF